MAMTRSYIRAPLGSKWQPFMHVHDSTKLFQHDQNPSELTEVEQQGQSYPGKKIAILTLKVRQQKL